jgi:hypothetical protein
MKLIDVVDCVEQCSFMTQRAFGTATEAGRFVVTITGRRLEAYQAVISALNEQEHNIGCAVVRYNGQHDYRIIESTGTISGFNEKALVEIATVCIRAVRFKHIQG